MGLGWDWDGIGSPGGRGYRAPYGANNWMIAVKSNEQNIRNITDVTSRPDSGETCSYFVWMVDIFHTCYATPWHPLSNVCHVLHCKSKCWHLRGCQMCLPKTIKLLPWLSTTHPSPGKGVALALPWSVRWEVILTMEHWLEYTAAPERCSLAD